MSWQVVGAVQRLFLDMPSKAVLLCYANETNTDSEQIAVAVETAGLLIGCSDRTVQNYVAAYQRLGVLIETEEMVGRGRARVWRIDVEAARYWFGVVPPYAERRAMKERGEDLPPFNNPTKGEFELKKGESGASFLERIKGARDTEKGECGSEMGAPPAPTPYKAPFKDSGRDRADAQAGGVDPPAQTAAANGVRPPPYNQLWTDRKAAIVEALGERWWQLWGANLIPVDPARDPEQKGPPGETAGIYWLACHAPWIPGELQDRYGPQLAGLLGQPVRLVYRFFVLKARTRDLEVEAGAESPGEDLGAWWRTIEGRARKATSSHFATHYFGRLAPCRFEAGQIVLHCGPDFRQQAAKHAADMKALVAVAGYPIILEEGP